MTITKLMVVAGVAAASLIGFGGAAEAAPAPTSAVVTCVNGEGVMSLTITNPAADVGAEFVVTNPETFEASVIEVPPGASQVVTLGGLPDGSVVVPVQLNGADVSVTSQISCDIPCTDGVVSLVTDDSGVQHQACVASAAGAPAAPPAKATLATPVARTASTSAPATLPTTGAGTSGLVIAAVLVGSGSVVSLLSRRRPAARRKRFRRRGLTP